MSVTRSEAAAALRDVGQTQARSFEARAYRIVGPQLIVWGVALAAGYGATGLLPVEAWWKIWLPVDLIALAVGLIVARRAPRSPTEAAFDARPMLRGAVMGVIIALFYGATMTVFQPRAPEAYLAFPGLLVGLIYALLGTARLPRMVWIGGAVLVLTLGGFLFLKPWLAFWMAAVVGGGLIVGGLWMRRL
ncbi:MAG: hypothetical protein JWP92_1537 [Caulobacter sp.]|nr:hypothetical protein [Caulobacter sp.]